MFGYIISVRNNKIFISSSSEPQEIYEKDFNKDVVDGSEILDTEAFAKNLGELIINEFGPNPEKQPLNFLVEPQDIIVNFIICDKNNGDDEAYLIEKAEKKLASQGLVLDDVYFSYQKIAPFVYQFVAMSKPLLEKYLDIAGDLEFELNSVVPWFFLLPRISENISESKTFIVDGGNSGLAIHTEFGGVKEVEKIDKNDFDKMVNEKKIVWDENRHKLLEDIFSEKLATTQINLLNLLPLPVEQKQPKALVYVGSAVTAILLIAGIYFGINHANTLDESDVLGGVKKDDQIKQSNKLVSEGDKNIQDEQSEDERKEEEEVEQEEIKEQEDVTEEFAKREYLRVKVLNSTQQSKLAGQTSTYLANLGYDTAVPDDYKGEEQSSTLVQLNPDFANYEDTIKEDLGEKFENIKITTDLEKDLDYNALIIVGTDEI